MDPKRYQVIEPGRTREVKTDDPIGLYAEALRRGWLVRALPSG